MSRGNMFTVYMDGTAMTLYLIGSYIEEYSGEEIAIMALLSQEDLIHIPVEELERLFPDKKYVH